MTTWRAIKGNSFQRGTVIFTPVTIYNDLGEKFEELVTTSDGKDASLVRAVLQIIATHDCIDVAVKTESPAGTELDLKTVSVAVSTVAKPTQAEVDRQSWNDAMQTELRQRLFDLLSPDTQKLMQDPAWLIDLPVGL